MGSNSSCIRSHAGPQWERREASVSLLHLDSLPGSLHEQPWQPLVPDEVFREQAWHFR